MTRKPKNIYFVYIELTAMTAGIIFIGVQIYRYFFPS
jgi:hypothetical protein